MNENDVFVDLPSFEDMKDRITNAPDLWKDPQKNGFVDNMSVGSISNNFLEERVNELELKLKKMEKLLSAVGLSINKAGD